MLLNTVKLFVNIGWRKMSTKSFVQTLNTLNNKMEWKIADDDYDFNQEIATSCYGDMLHDIERNKKFGEALEKAINQFHSNGKEAHVLDIGTGTGLLSMLAVRYGADSVTACETFLPMANCALRVIAENNFSDKIKIVKAHSTALTVGENGDLKRKANILVSEVFDTELIGEGAIKTFNHAFENLLTEDVIVIPSSGIVYAQIVESDKALKWNKLSDWTVENEVLLKVPEAIKNCSGAPAVHDIQLSEFNQKYFKPLSNPVLIFRFDWAKNKKIPLIRQEKSIVSAINSGKAQIVFMWWDLNMDEDGDIILSCAPVWEHPDGKGSDLDVKTLTKTLPWRDHWMQAVYFLTPEIRLNKNDTFTLVSNHDEFSFWFQVERGQRAENLEFPRPVCNCSFHFLQSRSRIGALNDHNRRNCYLEALKQIVTKDTVCIVLGDLSLLPFVAAKLGAKKVYALTENHSVEKVCHMLLVENGLTDIISIKSDPTQVVENINVQSVNESFDILLLSEPYFRNSILPWDNLAFWYGKNEFTICLKNAKMINSIRTFPMRSRLKGCAVQFDNLWKIATPLKECEGFSMKIFDDLIANAKDKAENYTEAQPLWEYPGIALSVPITFLEFDFTNDVPRNKIENNGNFTLEFAGRCDGVALWMEYDFSPECSLSFGPIKDINVGEYISWDMYERQGVHLFRINPNVKVGETMKYSAVFDPHEVEINFLFEFVEDC